MGIFGWSYPPGCSGPPEDNYPEELWNDWYDYGRTLGLTEDRADEFATIGSRNDFYEN